MRCAVVEQVGQGLADDHKDEYDQPQEKPAVQVDPQNRRQGKQPQGAPLPGPVALEDKHEPGGQQGVEHLRPGAPGHGRSQGAQDHGKDSQVWSSSA
jgi:hypothetical protein